VVTQASHTGLHSHGMRAGQTATLHSAYRGMPRQSTRVGGAPSGYRGTTDLQITDFQPGRSRRRHDPESNSSSLREHRKLIVDPGHKS